LNEEVPRRANFGANGGHACILEEVSVKYDTWESFIQYVKFDEPRKAERTALRLLPYLR
jgi:hypothetical protein